MHQIYLILYRCARLIQVPAPFDCYMVLRGLKTLHIRMREHSRNAQVVAEYLSGHAKIEKVIYPGMMRVQTIVEKRTLIHVCITRFLIVIHTRLVLIRFYYFLYFRTGFASTT